MQEKTMNSSRRAHALDALRGYAIVTMILSATEAFNVLPAWMYHAQVPPPDHIFNPTIYGITWVDLIFPFFLFSMGAAIPLSLGRLHEKGVSKTQLVWKSILRWLKLTFFAIFIMHAFPFMLGYEQEWLRYFIPIVCFGLLCLMFTPNPFHLSKHKALALKATAYIIATMLILHQPYAGGIPFRLTDSDIIMIILANVALTGSVIYLFTINKPLYRLAILPFLVAIFISAKSEGSWAAWLVNSSIATWLYQVPYQEYLLIIIPGTVAGEWIATWLKEETNNASHQTCPSKNTAWAIALLTIGIIICNVTMLFARELVLNLLFTLLLLIAMVWLLQRKGDIEKYWMQLYKGGAYLLLLGLCFEAYEGGIRKDDVTISYLLVTCGLAFFALLLFTIICDFCHIRWLSVPLELVGKNPMVAYVSSSMVVIPLLVLTKTYPVIDGMSSTPLLGFLKGIILTSASMLLTSWFTRHKYFWKT